MGDASFGNSKPAGTDLPGNKLRAGEYTLLEGVTDVCGDLVLDGNVQFNNNIARGRRPRDPEWSTLYGQEAPWLHLEHHHRLRVDHCFYRKRQLHPCPSGDGTLDFAAPTNGPWKGMAIYQDPELTTGVDISRSRKQPDLEDHRHGLSAQFQRDDERRDQQSQVTAIRASVWSSTACSSTARVRSWRTMNAMRQV